MSSYHNADMRTRFVEDLLVRHDTYYTLAAFHDWLMDNIKPEEEEEENRRLDLLKELMHTADHWSCIEGSHWFLCSWREHFKGLILLSTTTRDNLKIMGREPMAESWFTWTRLGDPDDKSEIPEEIIRYLHGWIIGGENGELFADPQYDKYEKHSDIDPIKDLSLACWSWGCDQLRHFFGVPKKIVIEIWKNHKIITRAE